MFSCPLTLLAHLSECVQTGSSSSGMTETHCSTLVGNPPTSKWQQATSAQDDPSTTKMAVATNHDRIVEADPRQSPSQISPNSSCLSQKSSPEIYQPSEIYIPTKTDCPPLRRYPPPPECSHHLNCPPNYLADHSPTAASLPCSPVVVLPAPVTDPATATPLIQSSKDGILGPCISGKPLLHYLEIQEKDICPFVLRKSTSSTNFPAGKIAPKFVPTVTAIVTICEGKLYKAKSSTLEEYFKAIWNISRSQVYRFLTCAKVLNCLKRFSIMPMTEPICRAMYQLTTDPSELELLWSKVLQCYQCDTIYSTLTPSSISDVWQGILNLRSSSLEQTHECAKVVDDETKRNRRMAALGKKIQSEKRRNKEEGLDESWGRKRCRIGSDNMVTGQADGFFTSSGDDLKEIPMTDSNCDDRHGDFNQTELPPSHQVLQSQMPPSGFSVSPRPEKQNQSDVRHHPRAIYFRSDVLTTTPLTSTLSSSTMICPSDIVMHAIKRNFEQRESLAREQKDSSITKESGYEELEFHSGGYSSPINFVTQRTGLCKNHTQEKEEELYDDDYRMGPATLTPTVLLNRSNDASPPKPPPPSPETNSLYTQNPYYRYNPDLTITRPPVSTSTQPTNESENSFPPSPISPPFTSPWTEPHTRTRSESPNDPILLPTDSSSNSTHSRSFDSSSTQPSESGSQSSMSLKSSGSRSSHSQPRFQSQSRSPSLDDRLMFPAYLQSNFSTLKSQSEMDNIKAYFGRPHCYDSSSSSSSSVKIGYHSSYFSET
ncbi:hypothetical protein BKA69DRAFT_674984 [Paraphysoderma sedebokerense]|nr:hypothetical protein BKA69DRAFT_674984 [Paraphysoderma sedebokerense]